MKYKELPIEKRREIKSSVKSAVVYLVLAIASITCAQEITAISEPPIRDMFMVIAGILVGGACVHIVLIRMIVEGNKGAE